ncbi:MAG: GcrA family cell cycle regulator [Pseudomonadota bacterium]
MAWTDERVEVLKTMWLAGSSASQIAAVLGDVTRNAVIGKVHRLGLSGRGKPTSTSAPRPRKPRATSSYSSKPRRSPTRGGPVSVGATALRTNPDANVVVALDAEPAVRGRADLVLVGESPQLSIQELNEDTCRWPVGDPLKDDFHFCGRKALENQPYCEYHCGIAFQSPAERRRERR